jgi:glycine/D-amino acid oxidase-like deaminating enzyme
MTPFASIEDAVIIGGGFYGTAIAAYLARQRGFRRIVVVEREPALLMRASCNNQARVHAGYHYPRSFTTAYRSQINMPLFSRDWPEALKTDFISLYAIARHNSKVTARQFERFCASIGASAQRADSTIKCLFEPRLIEEVFIVQEYVFDHRQLAAWARLELHELGIQVHYCTQATGISKRPDSTLQVDVTDRDHRLEHVCGRYVFNCTYGGLNQLQGSFPGIGEGLKQEITEIALLRLPDTLANLGVTVMDGAFFSIMPFPARGLHTLTHVRYTPHVQWADKAGLDPYQKLESYSHATRADRMLVDAERYIPAMSRATHVESLFEVKTVLSKTEDNDARPILFEQHPQLPGCYSVLGGKIDNIYDVLERLDAEQLLGPDSTESTGDHRQ